MKKEIEYWGEPEVERLMWTDKDEAIENIISSIVQNEGELEICGFSKKEHYKLDSDVEPVIDYLIDRWDERYGKDDEYTDITDDMIAVGEEFIKKMDKLYEVWEYEIVCREKIDIKKWITKNRPEWLKDEDGV